MIIGREVPGREGLRYARRTGQDPVYIMAVKTDKLSTKFEDWIEEDLLKLSSWDIKRIQVHDYSIDELRGLRERPGLTQKSSSMRSVGYRQFWDYLEHRCTLDQAKEKALFATRQLAKLQFTWLRSEESVFTINPLEAGAIDTISKHLMEHLGS